MSNNANYFLVLERLFQDSDVMDDCIRPAGKQRQPREIKTRAYQGMSGHPLLFPGPQIRGEVASVGWREAYTGAADGTNRT